MKKRLNTLGRIGIPKEIRDDMGLSDGDYLFIDYDANEKKITLTKESTHCAICQSTENLFELKCNQFLCHDCLKKIKRQFP